jgi:heterodisulfide reductase subunit B
LSAYLDEQTDAELKAKIEKHVTECPNCWVVADTTKKTIKVYKGMDACDIPPSIHERLMLALEKKAAAGS